MRRRDSYPFFDRWARDVNVFAQRDNQSYLLMLAVERGWMEGERLSDRIDALICAFEPLQNSIRAVEVATKKAQEAIVASFNQIIVKGGPYG